MSDLAALWVALETWDRARSSSFDLSSFRAQLYMGAMEIPMLAVRPREPVRCEHAQLVAFVPALDRIGLELDCVEVDRNYKLNRTGTKEYVGRNLPDALKLHAERILALGREAFEQVVHFYLALPRE